MEGAGRGLRAEGSGVRERGGVGPPPDAGRREVPSSRRTAGSPCGRWGCCGVRWCGAAVLRSPQPHQHRSSGAVREWVGGLQRGPAPAPQMSGARGTTFRVGYRRRAEPGKGNAGSASPAPHRPGEHSPAAVRPRPGVPGVHRDPCPRLRDAERHPRGTGTAPVPTAPGCGHSPAGGVGPGWGGGAGEAGGGALGAGIPSGPRGGAGIRPRAEGNQPDCRERPRGCGAARGGRGGRSGLGPYMAVRSAGPGRGLAAGDGRGALPGAWAGRGWGAEPLLTARVGWGGGAGLIPAVCRRGRMGRGLCPSLTGSGVR